MGCIGEREPHPWRRLPQLQSVLRTRTSSCATQRCLLAVCVVPPPVARPPNGTYGVGGAALLAGVRPSELQPQHAAMTTWPTFFPPFCPSARHPWGPTSLAFRREPLNVSATEDTCTSAVDYFFKGPARCYVVPRNTSIIAAIRDRLLHY